MIAVYMRVSTTKQDTRLQLAALIEYLKGRGLNWHSPMVRWFRDKGAASDAMSRPAWDRLMATVRAGGVREVVCWKLDRLNRWGAKDHLRFRLELDTLGVGVISLTEPEAVKFTDALDLMREVFYAEARADWLRTHRQRISAGVRNSAKRKASGWGGQRVPHGSKGGPKLTPDQAQSMRDEHAGGARVADLCRKYGVTDRTVRKHLRAGDAKDAGNPA